MATSRRSGCLLRKQANMEVSLASAAERLARQHTEPVHVQLKREQQLTLRPDAPRRDPRLALGTLQGWRGTPLGTPQRS